MIGFIKFIAPIQFIGDDSGNNPPPVGFIAWDEFTSWDNGVYWRGSPPPGQASWDLEIPWDNTTFWS